MHPSCIRLANVSCDALNLFATFWTNEHIEACHSVKLRELRAAALYKGLVRPRPTTGDISCQVTDTTTFTDEARRVEVDAWLYDQI